MHATFSISGLDLLHKNAGARKIVTGDHEIVIDG
jgi:hypothetical protein